MTFDLEKARDAAKFDDRMAITMFPLAIAEIERLRAELASATMTTYALATEYQQEMAKSWQITDEKRDAIEKAAHICHEVTAFDVAAALRAMLKEAGQ